MELVTMVAAILAIVGALNWGLVGLLKFDLVATICGGKNFGEVVPISRVVYIVVGLAGLLTLYSTFLG
jgi:uncharacterized membrane protein YuzA (DUF378 family)